MIAKDRRTAEVYLLTLSEQFDFDLTEWMIATFTDFCLAGRIFDRILVITDLDKMRSNYYNAAITEYFEVLRTRLAPNGRIGVL